MNKKMKQLLALFLAVLTLFSAVSISAATVTKTETSKTTLIRAKDGVYMWNITGKKESQGTLRTKEVSKGIFSMPCLYPADSNFKSSNSKIGTIKLDKESYWYNVKLKKAGKTTITYTGRSYTEEDNYELVNVKEYLNIYDYRNPVKSLKIGSKQFASGFKNSPFYSFKKSYSGKLSVTLAKGWKLIAIRQAPSGSTLMDSFSNNLKTLKKGAKVSTKKGAIEFIVYNTSGKYYTSIILGAGKNSNLIYG